MAGVSYAGAAELVVRKVAMTGDVAPGTGGRPFTAFNGPYNISPTGHVSFSAWYRRPDDSGNLTGIWRRMDGQPIDLIANACMTAADSNGGRFFGADASLINPNGAVAYAGFLELDEDKGIDDANREGIWKWNAAGVASLIARQGNEAPGTNGATFTGMHGGYYWLQAFNSSEQMVFVSAEQTVNRNPDGSIHSFDNQQIGIWGPAAGGALSVIAQAGEPAPETGGATFAEFHLNGGFNFGLNDGGQTAFSGRLTTGAVGVTESNDHGIWITDGNGATRLVVREGMAMPGIPGGTFGIVMAPSLNNAGDVAFTGDMRVGADARGGIWSSSGGVLTPLALTGQAGPMTGDLRFQAFSNTPFINAQGSVVFWAALDTTPRSFEFYDVGLWMADAGGNLKELAREGWEAPGTDGAIFAALNTLPSINGRGDVLFNGELKVGTAGVTSENKQGVWLYSAERDELTLLARTGMTWDVNDDPVVEDLRTIDYLSSPTGSGGQDGRRHGLSDRGEVLLGMVFTDGSQGIFVARLIPEPASAMVQLQAILGTMLARAASTARRRPR
jgi:hypothetical protein